MLPLLHVAQSTAGLSQVDRTVLGSAVAAFCSGLVAIWRPDNWVRLNPCRRHVRRRLSIVVAYGAIAVALFPSVLPLDHIMSPHEDSGAEQQVHASHCHESPGTCSDLPLLSGPGQFLASEPLLIAPALLMVLLLSAVAGLVGRSEKPEILPPRMQLTANT